MKKSHNRIPPYRGPVQAVILDWAGTAIDHGCIGPIAPFREVFKRRGVSVSVEEARRPMGLMKRDHILAMCRMESVGGKWMEVHGCLPEPADVDVMYSEVESLMAQAVTQHSDPIPGLLEAVGKFREQGLQIGSSTGYPRSVMAVLAEEAERKGYKPDSIVCSTDVPAGRPYPWMCYQNAINLQVHPLEAIVKIGDTVADIDEGLNAGMWTVALTQTGNELGLSEEEVEASDPEVLNLLIQLIEKRFREAGAHFVARSIGACPSVIETINNLLALGERP